MRRIVAALFVALSLAACSTGGSGGKTAGPAGTGAVPTTAPGGGAGDPAALLQAATAAAAHVCKVVPAALVETIVPGASAPTEEQFPPRCTWSNGTIALGVNVDVFNALGATPQGATAIPGVGSGAYLEKLASGDFYLSVGITKDMGVLHIEVNNQDGKDHTDQSVSVAKAILGGFGG